MPVHPSVYIRIKDVSFANIKVSIEFNTVIKGMICRSHLCSTEEIYISLTSYQAKADDELSFDADVMLKVVEKTLDGWWLVR